MSRDELNDKSSHATTETSGVELTMGCTHRSLNVQGGSKDPRLGDVLLGHRSWDPSVSVGAVTHGRTLLDSSPRLWYS
jgi:hypothetical protein